MHKPSPLKTIGFTLIEMLITIAIIAILMSIAMPSFSRYLKRAHYTEIVNAAAPFKLGVSECFQVTGSLDACNSDNEGVPNDITKTSHSSLIKSIQTVHGVITITPKNSYGFTHDDTYILTPSNTQDTLSWQRSGGGVDHGYTY